MDENPSGLFLISSAMTSYTLNIDQRRNRNDDAQHMLSIALTEGPTHRLGKCSVLKMEPHPSLVFKQRVQQKEATDCFVRRV